MIKGYQELKVWEKADELAHQVFDASGAFPQEFRFDLTAQLRRAALSVPTNIAEGSATAHTKELLQFLSIARRSTAEVKYLLQFARRRKLLDEPEYRVFVDGYEEVHRMLHGLVTSLRLRRSRNGREK